MEDYESCLPVVDATDPFSFFLNSNLKVARPFGVWCAEQFPQESPLETFALNDL